MKKALMISILVFMLFFAFSCASVPEDTGDFECEFDTKTNTAAITGYKGNEKNVVIPDSFGNFTVKSIARGAFSKQYDIKSVTLPNNLEKIDTAAFEYCISLETILFPDSLKTIGNTVFYSCRGLKEIYINENIESIGVCVFTGCTSLEKIEVSENNKNYSSDSYGALLDKNYTKIIQYPIGSERTTYEMPETVLEIESYAFEKSAFLEYITFSESLKKIGSYAFQSSGILEVVFKDNLEEIGFSCFKQANLIDISLGDNVKKIGESAFSWCVSLTEINIPASVTEIGRSAFYMCTAVYRYSVDQDNTAYASDEHGILFDKDIVTLLYYPIARIQEYYTIPSTVHTISPNAFTPTLNLKKITIPDSVETIGDKAFAHCINLTEIIYEGTKPANISDNAFEK